MHREVVYTRSIGRLPLRLLAGLVHGWRRAWVAWAQWLLFSRPRGTEKRVAVYRIGSIGDMVHALPALAAISARHKDAEITLVSNADWPAKLGLDRALNLQLRTYKSPHELADCVRGADCLYYLAPHPLRAWRALRDMLFFTGKVRRAIGFRALAARGWIARARRPWVEALPQHRLLLAACNLTGGANVSLPLGDTPPAPKPYAVIAATGKSDVQHWPDARFRVLAGKIDARGLRPIWVGDEEDGKRLGGGLIGLNYFGKLDFAQMAALLAGASVVIANDSGLAHLAGCVGAPVVVTASARAERNAWTPPGERVTVIRKDMSCEACHLRQCSDTACTQAITVDDVMTAVEKWI